MKAVYKVAAVLIAVTALAGTGFFYLRHEQRVEGERYQTGFTDGIGIGALEARKKLLDQVDCYPVVTVEADHLTEDMICGVRVSKSDIEDGAIARGRDLEQ